MRQIITFSVLDIYTEPVKENEFNITRSLLTPFKSGSFLFG
jgi:hypothetical protein